MKRANAPSHRTHCMPYSDKICKTQKVNLMLVNKEKTKHSNIQRFNHI